MAANLQALAVLANLDEERRPATEDEQSVLARWSGWGAISQAFDAHDERFASERDLVRSLLGDSAWQAARRTTLNAHYTDAGIVTAIWRAVSALGFDGGAVLEPGCGCGNFIGFAPEAAAVTGVELDPTTARIAEHLYGGRASIQALPFERFEPTGDYDLVVGNVPFGDVVPHDPRRNPNRHRLHNYFLIKSLQLTRPGGLVAALTSRYTLDARNPAARREMASLADLVGAVRLPARAFAAAAGTDVVCDLVILRRRGHGAEPGGLAWTTVVPVDDHPTDPVWCNELFVASPRYVCGRLEIGRGMYRQRELTVAAEGSLDAALDKALAAIIDEAAARDLRYAPRRPADQPETVTAALRERVSDGAFVIDGHRFARVLNGRVEPYKPRFRADAPELRALIGLRDAARGVLDLQRQEASDELLAPAQAALVDRYEAYVRRYGPINRYKLAGSGRGDPRTGEEIRQRIRPRMRGFRDDPDWFLVAALEVFDDETQVARPAPIFTTRVISPPSARLGVDTPDEAVAVCLDVDGEVTLERAADLLGVRVSEARPILGELVWEEPQTGELVPAAGYLSGNVRQKLAVATAAAERDERFAANVAALTAVLPRQLEPARSRPASVRRGSATRTSRPSAPRCSTPRLKWSSCRRSGAGQLRCAPAGEGRCRCPRSGGPRALTPSRCSTPALTSACTP